jgi:hypothetical protein
MANRILVSVGAFVLIVASLGGVGVWLGLPCGPSTCPDAGWLYDFQNLVAGLAALAAAGVAAFIPEYFRRESDRRSQISHGNRISIEIAMLAATLCSFLLSIKEERSERPGLVIALHLPKLRSLIRQARVMMEGVGATLSGPDDAILLRIVWRIASFRNAVEGADNLAQIFGHEAEDGRHDYVSDEGIDGVITELQRASSEQLPDAMAAAFLRDQKNSLRPQKA